MHRPRKAFGWALAIAVAAVAFTGSAVAVNGHGGSPPGQQKKQSSHGNSANAPGHTKGSKPASSGAKGSNKKKPAKPKTSQPSSSSSPSGTQTTAGDKVLVCHKTGSATNPFVVISISINGWTNGHSKHPGDILLGPSFPGDKRKDPSLCVSGGTTSTTTTTTPSTTTTTTTGSTTTTTTTGSTSTTTQSTTSTTTGSTSTTTSTSTTAAAGAAQGSGGNGEGGVLGAQASKPAATGGVLGALARTATRGQLPFTGLPVWVPALMGLVLIGLGLALRRHGRPSGI